MKFRFDKRSYPDLFASQLNKSKLECSVTGHFARRDSGQKSNIVPGNPGIYQIFNKTSINQHFSFFLNEINRYFPKT